MPDVPISVFISYSRTDTTLVDKLEDDLVARNFRPWVDRRRLEGGQEWLDVIQEAINSCDVLVVLLTPDAVRSKFVRMEYRYAQRKDKVVIPVLYRPCEIPIDLIDIHHVNFEGSYETGLKELLSALSHMKANGSVPQSTPEKITPRSALRHRPSPATLRRRRLPEIRTYGSSIQKIDELPEIPKVRRANFQIDDEIVAEDDRPPQMRGPSSARRYIPPRTAQEDEILDDDIFEEDDQPILRRPSSARRYIPPRTTQDDDNLEEDDQLIIRRPSSARRYTSPRTTQQSNSIPLRSTVPAPQRRTATQTNIPLTRNSYLSTHGSFIKRSTSLGGLETNSFVVWCWIFALLVGAGCAVDILTQLWFLTAVALEFMTVGVVASLAYVLCYRRAVHLNVMVAIAVISISMVFYLSQFVFNLSSLTAESQLKTGLILGIFGAIVSTGVFFWCIIIIYADATSSFALGLLAGAVFVPVVWAVAPIFNWAPGFWFGGWWESSLAAAVGLLGGTGLGVSCFVWLQALVWKEGDLD
ncbi:MAG TPA: toll/interleukin-1 receptor domain-containing protein [Ktedonobacteraceae bacterium]|nr:toll/interleukin-1 receptor domain-containing protein [Ktedonobacteraceae bacterium]